MWLSHVRYHRKYLEVDKVITGKTVTVFSQNVSLSLVYRACIHVTSPVPIKGARNAGPNSQSKEIEQKSQNMLISRLNPSFQGGSNVYNTLYRRKYNRSYDAQHNRAEGALSSVSNFLWNCFFKILDFPKMCHVFLGVLAQKLFEFSQTDFKTYWSSLSTPRKAKCVLPIRWCVATF